MLLVLLISSGTSSLCHFFFFQAEDGIRDYKVTGVQTCALPIWHPRRLELAPKFTLIADADASYLLSLRVDAKGVLYAAGGSPAKVFRFDGAGQIGRASCRERV